MSNVVLKKIETDFKNCPDLVKKQIKLGNSKVVYVLFLETVSSSDKVSNYILNTLSRISTTPIHKKVDKLFDFLPSPNTVELKDKDEIEFYLTNGFAIVITDFSNEIIAIETKADLDRGINTPETQQGVFGPKDAFIENYQKNIGLIKRRIKSKSLVTEETNIGKRSNTKVGLLYINDIADIAQVNKIKKKLSKINTDGIIDSSYINQFITGENINPLPTCFASERPDRVCNALLEGKIAIVVDGSSFVLLLPAFLIDFINPVVDNYNKSININFVKILRFFCFLLTILTPAFYIAITNYNPETIPTNLLINFSAQRDGIPFPAIVECLITLFTIELLKESDLRFPSSYGSAVSILGALVLGEAAIGAGLVTPIMIIVAALTFITSLLFNDQELVNATRFYRILYLFFATLLGLYGIIIASMFFVANLASTKTLDKPYTYPLAPFDSVYFNKTLLKKNRSKDRFRSKLLVKKDRTKQG